MDLQLRGKRTLVTGSTAGIGFAAAAGLYHEGASFVVNGRTAQRVEEAAQKIRGLGGDGEVTGVVADLSTFDGVPNSSGTPPRWTSWSTTWASSSRSRLRRSPTPTGFDSSRSTS